MSVGLDFDFSRLDAAVNEFVRNSGNVSAVLPGAAAILVESVDQMFATEGGSGLGGEWKKSKRAEEQDGMTLNNTGMLAGSITGEFGTSGGLSEAWVEAGTNVPYAVYHLPPEKSDHASKGIMPVRDFLDIDMDSVLEEITDLFLETLTK